ELGLAAPPKDDLLPSGRPPVSDLLLQRLGGVGKGLVFCRVRDGGSIANLSVFVERPAEAAIAQKIGLNPDRERVIFSHLNNMGHGGTFSRHAVWLSISN